MTDELLLEIGTEEIPAAFMPDALSALKSLLEKELTAKRIDCKKIEACGTPRRLVLMAYEMAAVQTDLTIEKMGPAKKIAFDDEGKPSKAAIGFAKGMGIDISEVTIVTTEKGDYICAKKHEKGAPTRDLLPEILAKVISQLPFPKSMRWRDLDIRFARPIHWIVALFNTEVVPFTYGNISSGDTTRGHRFMAPGSKQVANIASYLETVAKAHVVIDSADRIHTIKTLGDELAHSVKGKLMASSALLNEVGNLIEAPFPVLGSFDKSFLDLPPEVLTTSMEKHQKYFPVIDDEGRLLPYFIAVNNTNVKDRELSINGHERVLRARLSDARFFYAEDQKKSLPGLTESLKNVLYQKQLGTSYEKMERFRGLAGHLAKALGNPAITSDVERTAYLCKADLVSEMVGEFPGLQGIMGREYARLAGETDVVSHAIFEHYLPRFAEDELPQSDVGAIVSIADKLDSIAGCFSIGLVPTGTADPYALRRQCLGIINIILDKGYTLSLKDLVAAAVERLSAKTTRPADEIISDVLAFFSGRLSNLLSSQGQSHDVVDAVLTIGINNLTDDVNRIKALGQMKKDPNFEALSVSFKRVVNIIKKASAGTNVDPAGFEHDAERMLHKKYLEIRDKVHERMAQKKYLDALQLISTIRESVDAFFDSVMVMAEDKNVQQNRLALLSEIASLFTNFADFSKISVE